jgi:hypothetical protein
MPVFISRDGIENRAQEVTQSITPVAFGQKIKTVEKTVNCAFRA